MTDHRSPAYLPVSLGQFGERARPLEAALQEAALVIGLGQVGLKALARAHDMLGALLTPEQWQQNIRLLAISRRPPRRDDATLPHKERLTLAMEPPPWTDVPGRYASLNVTQWWPHSPRMLEAAEDPALVRAYHRLLLFDNAETVSQELYDRVQWLDKGDLTADGNPTRSPSQVRRIYVLASLAESESSGMIFDIVTRLRLLVSQPQPRGPQKPPVTITGIFSLSAPDSKRDPEHLLAMANAYATLREMDAYTLHPETFPSDLPVIGHKLARADTVRALDTILLADDAASPRDFPPECALAECVTSWIAASLHLPGRASTLPQPIPHKPGVDRFKGYSTFGVSKLALPIRAAMDLSSSGLAQTVLKAAKSTHSPKPAAAWVAHIVSMARAALVDSDVLTQGSAKERYRDWHARLGEDKLGRLYDTRIARNEAARMLETVQAEMGQLELEMITETQIADSVLTARPDSLRNRVETQLTANLGSVEATLLNSPLDLAYAQGLGLIWTANAFEDLKRNANAALSGLQQAVEESQAGYRSSRQKLFELAQQYDRPAGRFSGGHKVSLPEIAAAAQTCLDAAAHLVADQTRLDLWRRFIEIVDEQRDQVRAVIPQIDQAIDSVHSFENACRAAMDLAARQPRFPAAAIVTEDWYNQGIQELNQIAQIPPADLLRQIYDVWVPARDLPPERRLSAFLFDVRDSARRLLADSFRFANLHDFLRHPFYSRKYDSTVSALPSQATPVLYPENGDKYPPPEAFEIVREVPRPFSLLAAPRNGVVRTHIPSPDPDEITVIRVLHGMMAEALPMLREAYRRAYDRAVAEGLPMHIDRLWDSTMADLVHTNARREIAVIWEEILHLYQTESNDIQLAVDRLVEALGKALDVLETSRIPNLPDDLHLVNYRLRPFRLKLPPPNCAALFLYSDRSVAELSDIIFKAVTPLPMEEQFLLVINITGRPDVEQIVESLRRVDFTVLVLNEADVKHIISARMPTRVLSDLVLSQVNLTTVSPFYTRGPVPDHMFFGREREVSEIRSKLRTHSVALIGGRRIGKTSMLQRLQRLLEPAESDYAPYYIDCYSAANYKSFFWLVNRRWKVNTPSDYNPITFEDVVTQLQDRHPGKSLVILMDEIDGLLRFDQENGNGETLFRALRSLSNEKRVQFVFSGEKWLMRAAADSYSGLYNFAQVIRLEPLPRDIVHHLVADPFELLNIWMERSDQVIERIYEISAGHPNIVQMICQGMIEELDQDRHNTNLLSYNHLDRATARHRLQEEIVRTIWGQMDDLSQMVTLIWPEEQDILSLAQIEQYLLDTGLHNIPAEELQRTAKDLELYCFVRSLDNDRLNLIPLAFPAILDFMTDKQRHIEIVRDRINATRQNRQVSGV